MQCDIKTRHRSCLECAASKNTTPLMPRAPLVQQKQAYPFERIAMDIVGPLTESSAGNRFILVMSAYFTKWPEIFSLRNQKAATVAKTLMDDVFCRYGVPTKLHSEKISKLFRKYVDYSKKKKKLALYPIILNQIA